MTQVKTGQKETFTENSISEKLDAFKMLCASSSASQRSAELWRYLYEGGDRRLRADEIDSVRKICRDMRVHMRAIEDIMKEFEKIKL